jgi:hypothetical protein
MARTSSRRVALGLAALAASTLGMSMAHAQTRAAQPTQAAPPPASTAELPDLPPPPQEQELPPPPPLSVAVPPGPPPPPAPPPRPREPAPARPPDHDDGAGPRITSGRVFSRGLSDGWYGRFETEYFEIHGRDDGVGRVSGVMLGLEGWGSADGGGGGIPLSVYGGFRLPFFRRPLSLGLGWDWLIVDRIQHVTGVGILAPFGTGTIGIDLRGIRLLADARAQYRWEWGADDRVQLRIGASLSVDSEWWDK